MAANYRVAISIGFFITITLPTFSQVLSGTYLRQNRMNGSRQFTFSQGKFSEKIVTEAGETFGKGNFRIASGKLLLTYEKLLDSNASTFSMKVFNTLEQGAIVNFKIFSDDSKSPPTMVGVNNVDGSIIASFTTDEFGKIRAYVNDEKTARFLTVVKPGYNRLEISMDTLKKKASEVVVKLKAQDGRYYIEPHTIKYNLIQDGIKFTLSLPEHFDETFKKVD